MQKKHPFWERPTLADIIFKKIYVAAENQMSELKENKKTKVVVLYE